MSLWTKESAASTAKELVEQVDAVVRARGIAFATFLLGVTLEDPTVAGDELDEWRSSVKRGAANALWARWGGARDVLFRHPDVVFVWDVRKRELEARIAPVYVYGRYVKLARDLPQTRWHCRKCRGRGCPDCRGTGRQHASSVEELIGDPLARAHRSGAPVLHGMGREDMDVRTLAPGRPFVVELKEPLVRSVDLAECARAISTGASGQVELGSPLRYAKPSTVARVKTLEPAKRYRARVRAEAPVDPSRVAGLAAAFTGVTLRQETPSRVLRRRADLVRPRRVLELEASLVAPEQLEIRVLAEAGTYIKELVSGDGGRTAPSIAGFLGTGASVVELDVVEVLVDEAALLGT
jgi:tRNA pseudouridine synthase 10